MPGYEIKIIENSCLREHEQIRKGRLAKLLASIKKDGHVKNPIIVDRDSMVILDGHHRFNCLKCLGLKLCPVCLVDYRDCDIKVCPWRKGEKITKEDVLNAGITGKKFTPKTSRHIIPNRPKGLNIPLAELQ
jgi:hypothetical protein